MSDLGLGQDLVSSIQLAQDSIVGLSKEQASVVLDAKERSLFNVILSLRIVRNTIVPFHIPDDVLVHIFGILVEDLRHSSESARGRISWLNITKVCRHWRRVALDAPVLWTLIDARNMPAVQMFLHYSKSAPLDIFMPHVGLDTVNQTMRLVEPHLGRVRKLEASLRSADMKALITHLHHAAPTLETLCFRQRYSERVLSSNREQALVVDTIFENQTPSLRRLSLDAVSIPWTPSIFSSSLIHLHLHTQHPASAPSMTTFLEILEACQGLQTLSLVSAGPSLPEDIIDYPNPTKLVKLPHLRELLIHNRPVDIAHVLANLELPSTTTIVLSSELDNVDGDIFAVLPRDCTALQSILEIRALLLCREDECLVSITAGRTLQVKEALLNVDIASTVPLLPNLFLPKLGSRLPLPKLEILHVTDCGPDLSWRTALSNLPKLTTLIVIDAHATQHSLMQALQMQSLGGEDVVCPQLKVLKLEGLDFTDEVEQNLGDLCRNRVLNGVPLQTLGVPGLPSERADVLSGLVSHVDNSIIW